MTGPGGDGDAEDSADRANDREPSLDRKRESTGGAGSEETIRPKHGKERPRLVLTGSILLAILSPFLVALLATAFPKYAAQMVGTLLLVVGGSLVGVAVWLVRDRRRFLSRAVKVKGIVTSVSASFAQSARPGRRFVVEYSPEPGKPRTVTSSWSSGTLRVDLGVGSVGLRLAPDEGDPVDVHYDPDKPENAVIDTFWELWGGACFLLLLGAPFAAVAVYCWVPK